MSRSLERWVGAIAVGTAVGGTLVFFASLHELPFDPCFTIGSMTVSFDPRIAFVSGLASAAFGTAIAFGVYLSQREDW